jgi:hypothetical protein
MKDDELDRLIEVVMMPDHVPDTPEGRIAAIEDRQRINDLVMLYGWLCDRRRWDELLEHYTEDFERCLAGTLEERVKGKEKLRELYFRPVLPRSADRPATPPADQINSYELRHLIHPPVIRLSENGNEATVAAVYSLVATSGDGAAFQRGEHEGAYLFGMRREPEVGWRFATMTVISENARNPLFQASA